MLQKGYEERTVWATSLDEETRHRGERIVALQKELEERTQWALRLDDELKQSREKITILEAKIIQAAEERRNDQERFEEELAKKNDLIDAYRNSISWKITAPLRAAFDLILKKRDRGEK